MCELYHAQTLRAPVFGGAFDWDNTCERSEERTSLGGPQTPCGYVEGIAIMGAEEPTEPELEYTIYSLNV